MTWADYAILAVIALSVLTGLWRGLVAEVLALAIWVLAFWVAWAFGPALAARLAPHVATDSVRVILAYGICFLLVLIAGGLLRFLIGKLIASTGLSGTDRLLGLVFGLARGIVIVTAAVFLLALSPFTRDAWWQQSRLLPSFAVLAGWLAQELPARLDAAHDAQQTVELRLPEAAAVPVRHDASRPIQVPPAPAPAPAAPSGD